MNWTEVWLAPHPPQLQLPDHMAVATEDANQFMHQMLVPWPLLLGWFDEMGFPRFDTGDIELDPLWISTTPLTPPPDGPLPLGSIILYHLLEGGVEYPSGSWWYVYTMRWDPTSKGFSW